MSDNKPKYSSDGPYGISPALKELCTFDFTKRDPISVQLSPASLKAIDEIEVTVVSFVDPKELERLKLMEQNIKHVLNEYKALKQNHPKSNILTETVDLILDSFELALTADKPLSD